MTFPEIKAFLGKLVLLKCADGERIKAKVLFVDEEYQDVVMDVLSTDKLDNWARGHPNSDSSYTISLAEIVAVEEIN